MGPSVSSTVCNGRRGTTGVIPLEVALQNDSCKKLLLPKILDPALTTLTSCCFMLQPLCLVLKVRPTVMTNHDAVAGPAYCCYSSALFGLWRPKWFWGPGSFSQGSSPEG
jgi:hypothetical protein